MSWLSFTTPDTKPTNAYSMHGSDSPIIDNYYAVASHQQWTWYLKTIKITFLVQCGIPSWWCYDTPSNKIHLIYILTIFCVYSIFHIQLYRLKIWSFIFLSLYIIQRLFTHTYSLLKPKIAKYNTLFERSQFAFHLGLFSHSPNFTFTLPKKSKPPRLLTPFKTECGANDIETCQTNV